MAEINITKDCKLIKVLAAQARNERVESDKAQEAANIITDLTTDLNPQNMHMIAQTIAYTLTDLQKNELPFLNQIADVKNVGHGDKAAFEVPTGRVKAYIQAKGATTARSMVANRQMTVDTIEVSARPAINIVDLRSGRKNMAELIREANIEMSNQKMKHVQKVLAAAINTYTSPYFASGAGVVQGTIDDQILHFRRLGNVALLGDIAPLGK